MTNHEIAQPYDRVVAVNVDVQNDFCPGGALGVDEGATVIAPINQVSSWTRQNNGLVVYTRDWHLPQSKHFADFGGPWPVHCVQETEGAALRSDLDVYFPTDLLMSKGMDVEDDGYSGFEAKTEDGQTLEALITPEETERVAVLIGGLATDYCIKSTVLDGCKIAQEINNNHYPHPLDIYVIEDAIRAVNLNPDDGENAKADMKLAGARFVNSRDVIQGNAILLG